MVSSTVKNDHSLVDEDIDDISHEKHRQLLQKITSKSTRKYTIKNIEYIIIINI